jgi:hypothetical protein
MGDHTHHKGGWMLSYRLMRMDMNDMRKGTNDVSSPDIFAANYTVAPERMTMDMHMFGFMYAASDKLTLMAMRNYIESDMSHRIHPGSGMLIAANGGSEQFTTKTSGWGDTQLTALYKFYDKDQQKAHLGLGLNLPTGSVAAKDRIPIMGMGLVSSVLPAPMQLGSGTYDLLPSLTFRQQFEEWSYGVQASGIVRLQDNNDRDYRHGHQFGLTSWAGYVLSDWISLGGGLSYKWSGTLKGDQQDINQGPMMGRNTVTTAYGDNYGGETHRRDSGGQPTRPQGRTQRPPPCSRYSSATLAGLAWLPDGNRLGPNPRLAKSLVTEMDPPSPGSPGLFYVRPNSSCQFD